MKNKKKSRFLFQSAQAASILLMGVLAACTFPTSESLTATPTPTTEEIPSEPPDATQMPEPPTPTATDVTEEGGDERAPEAVLITSPGPNSWVSSPLVVEGKADPSLGDTVTISLFEISESGNPYEDLLAEEVVELGTQSGGDGPFRVELSYTPRQIGNQGWIMVSVIDPEDGGLVHVNTVQVDLQTAEQEVITAPEQVYETIEIQTPQANQVISGGTLEISGYSEYFFESNLGVIVCWTGAPAVNEDHRLCGSPEYVITQGNAMIAAPDMGFPGPFSGAVSYNIQEDLRARLVVYATSPRDGSLLHLSSVDLVLQP